MAHANAVKAPPRRCLGNDDSPYLPPRDDPFANANAPAKCGARIVSQSKADTHVRRQIECSKCNAKWLSLDYPDT